MGMIWRFLHCSSADQSRANQQSAKGIDRTKQQKASRMRLAKLTHLILAGFVAVAIGTPAQAGEFSFPRLGFLSPDLPRSTAYGVSADGLVVVGSGNTDFQTFRRAFRWTSSSGMMALGDLPGGGVDSECNAVSADGSVVVGGSKSPAGYEAFRWTSGGGMVGLGFLPGGSTLSEATSVSADGLVVVGGSSTGSGFQAFRWTSGGGMVGLSFLPGGSYSEAFGISADGSVVVGEGSSNLGPQAFRWTSDGGITGLGDLSGGDFFSRALGVSADGSAVVGFGKSEAGNEAFRWTNSGGMVGLGDLPGGDFYSIANSVSADGSVVVGVSKSAAGYEAFVWSSGTGMVNLRDLLVGHGVSNLTGWELISAESVSSDGRTIVGFGANPERKVEAWIATIPEPATITLAATGLACACLLAARRHVRQRAFSRSQRR